MLFIHWQNDQDLLVNDLYTLDVIVNGSITKDKKQVLFCILPQLDELIVLSLILITTPYGKA